MFAIGFKTAPRSSLVVKRVRMWGCHCCSSGCCCGAGSIPGAGTSICCGCSQKKKKKTAPNFYFNLGLTLYTIRWRWPCEGVRGKCPFFFCLRRATPTAYGGSQAGGRIGIVPAGLRHSHSNSESKPHLQPTPQLMATLDP